MDEMMTEGDDTCERSNARFPGSSELVCHLVLRVATSSG